MKIEKIINSGAKQFVTSVTVQTDDAQGEPKFVPTFSGEYYSISHREKQQRADCPACGKTGKLKGLDGKEYECPNCHGNWRNRLVVGVIRQWYIRKYRLTGISVTQDRGADCLKLNFECVNDDSGYYSRNNITVTGSDITTMKFDKYAYGKISDLESCLTDNYAEAMAEIKLLNKAEKEKDAADDEGESDGD